MNPLLKLGLSLLAVLLTVNVSGAERRMKPEIDGPWWTVATSPELGELSTPKQQPVDFAIWPAADGTWQLWSCIRGTREPGKTRLFYRWEGKHLTDTNWTPMGIALHADPQFGETPGGLQAPFVFKHEGLYYMFFGDWENICLATSHDGKTFTRKLNPDGKSSLFTEGRGTNTRDAMVVRIGPRWYCYYTAFPNQQGAVYCRTSADLIHWSDSEVVAFGGQAGTGPYAAECPFLFDAEGGSYLLFRTQRYGADAKTSLYISNDPLRFGINQDEKYLAATLPVAAPEIILHQGQYYMAALLPSLKGIQIAKLRWSPAR